MTSFAWVVFIITFILFIIFWRKKATVRKAAGESYREDEKYKSASKTKRIIGVVCVLALVFGIFGASNSSEKDDTSAKQVTKTSQSEKNTSTEPKWNSQEVDSNKNGNFAVAAKLVKQDSNLAAKAEDADASIIIKRPWDYYGKVIRFTGQVAVLSDYPPSSDSSKALGGDSADIVMTVKNGSEKTIVETVIKGSTASIKTGQTVTVFAYPIGHTEVKNKIGGTFTHLECVGVLQ